MFNMMPYRYNRVVRSNNNSNYSLNPFADDFFRAFFGDNAYTGALKVDVQDEGDHYLLEADMPGVSKENLHVDVEDGVMTIHAESAEEKEDKKTNYLCRERRAFSASRSFSLEGIRESDITAEFKDGVLRLTLPKQVEQPKETARKIEIA